MPLHLEIVTPERRAFVGDVDEVIVPGSEGEMGILPHHAPLISLLGQGVLRLKRGGQEEEKSISSAPSAPATRPSVPSKGRSSRPTWRWRGPLCSEL